MTGRGCEKMPGTRLAVAGITSHGDVGTQAASKADFIVIFDVVMS
jgi:hypothetical protein